MRIGASLASTVTERARPTDVMSRRFTKEGYNAAQVKSNDVWIVGGGNRMQGYEMEETGDERSEAEKIYHTVKTGGKNPAENIRQASKVPYGYLAKDGVITYNGVTFVCDEKTNSICLGDMTDKKKVLNIPLSGGGHLKVNRDNLGDLAKAIGMFSPEDVNRIMRAIHQDTKIQSMQQEMEDMENSVGEDLKQTREGGQQETEQQDTKQE
ncbi:MAG: hypothetical protein J1E03_08625 [Acetatifactor sp.]|nr:hypothetical protein [Acetatifactor sp.]